MNPSQTAGLTNNFGSPEGRPDQVIFKNDRIYRHHILQINYTTYDVHRADDILNPNTEHCDIMMLHSPEDAYDHQQFCYSRIIRIYHANVQYIGPGMKDYTPQQMDFLHVRWFERVPQQDIHDLEAVRFVCMDDPAVFDFVDPADILRSCHLLPAFRFRRCHQGQIATSPIARNSEDWKFYYVNRYDMFPCSLPLTYSKRFRFVDSDMLLRYYWGLGVRHTYSHVPGSPSQSQSFAMRENSPLARSSSSSAIPVSSQPRNYTGNSDAAMADSEDSGDHDAPFMLPQLDDLDSAGEWEVEEVGCEEEDSEPQSDDDDVQTMYALYDDGVNSGSDW
jgi:hypothetical protein